MSLRERIQYILDKERISQRELARRSGLPSEVHVGQILRRLADDPNAAVETKTLNAIADGGRVSRAWLLSGRGNPSDADRDEGPARRATFSELPGWAETLGRARLLEPELPDWVWEQIGVSVPLLSAPLTPAMIAELGRWMLRHEASVRNA